MPKPTIRIHNVETGEIIDREMTNAEFAAYQADQKIRQDEETIAAQKVANKLALLDKLGITEEEAKLLLL